MEETALEFKNMCPYILPDNDIEDEADECVYETLEKLYRHTIFDLEQRADMEFFTPQYKLMFAEMDKFFKKSKNLRVSNKYLQSELASTIAELQAMQKLSAIDKEMIEQLKEEIEKKWNEKLESLDDDEETKVSKELNEQIHMLSLLTSEKDGVIIELKDALDTLSKIRDSTNEDRKMLLQENEHLKQELIHITKVKQNIEDQYLHAEEKLKELNEHLQAIDAELLTERNEKEQLRNDIVNMTLEINSTNERCQKLEQELEAKSTDTVSLKNEDYIKLCAEFEKANAAINDLTEQKNQKEEEIEKLKELLHKTSSDVKHIEETVKNLQEMNSQLTHEKKELATMLHQYEMKRSVEQESDSFIQEEEIKKRDLSQVFCTKNVFEKLTEECEMRNLKTKESFRHLKRYSGTLRDVIKGLEEQVALL